MVSSSGTQNISILRGPLAGRISRTGHLYPGTTAQDIPHASRLGTLLLHEGIDNHESAPGQDSASVHSVHCAARVVSFCGAQSLAGFSCVGGILFADMADGGCAIKGFCPHAPRTGVTAYSWSVRKDVFPSDTFQHNPRPRRRTQAEPSPSGMLLQRSAHSSLNHGQRPALSLPPSQKKGYLPRTAWYLA